MAVSIARSESKDFEYHVVELYRGHSAYTPVFIEELKRAGIKYHRGFVPEIHFHYAFERLAAVLFPLRFLPLFLRHRPDVVHCHTEMPELAVSLFFSLFPRLLRRCKVVRTIHNTQLWTGLKHTGLHVEAFMIKRKANIAISEAVRDNYLKIYGSEAPIIYNGVAETPQEPFNGLSEDRMNILFAGRLEPQKGVDVLIETVIRMKDDKRYHFHIMGDGSMRRLVEARLGTQANVTLHAPVHGLAARLSSFDYLFMPSVFEGLSIMSIEASLASLPVIASGCPGLRDTLPADWPLNVPDNTPDSYVRLFREVIPQADRAQLGKTAYGFAAEHFGIRRMQTAYEQVYNA